MNRKENNPTHISPSNENGPESLTALLDSLVPLTFEELEAAHLRCPVRSEEAAMHAAKSFREEQPGIYGYIPYDSSTPVQERQENAHLCAWARRLCSALQNRFGRVPVLKTEDLQAAEARARKALEQYSLRGNADALKAVQSTGGAWFAACFDPTNATPPLKRRLVLKMLSIWMCFSQIHGSSSQNVPSGSTSQRPSPAISLITPAEFTHEAAGLLQRLAPDINTEILDELELNYSISKDHDGDINLSNAYREYLCKPDRKGDILVHYLSSILDTIRTPPDKLIDTSRVMPMLKPASWVVDEDCVYQHFSGDLVITYVVDEPRQLRYLNNRDLADLKLPLDDLHQTAMKNLEGLLPGIRIQQVNGICEVKVDNNYESSLLLLDRLWNQTPFQVSGEIVVAVPARNSLFVTGSEDIAAIRRISELARDIAFGSPYSVSSELLIRRDGRFLPYPTEAGPDQHQG